MPSRKKKSLRPRSTTRVEELDTKAAEIQHYNGVLIEELRSDFKFVIEKVMSLDEKIDRTKHEVISEMRQEFAIVNAVLQSHSEMLISQNKTLASHSEILAEHSEILAEHGKKLSRIETRLDDVCEKVEDHDQKLKRLLA